MNSYPTFIPLSNDKFKFAYANERFFYGLLCDRFMKISVSGSCQEVSLVGLNVIEFVPMEFKVVNESTSSSYSTSFMCKTPKGYIVTRIRDSVISDFPLACSSNSEFKYFQPLDIESCVLVSSDNKLFYLHYGSRSLVNLAASSSNILSRLWGEAKTPDVVATFPFSLLGFDYLLVMDNFYVMKVFSIDKKSCIKMVNLTETFSELQSSIVGKADVIIRSLPSSSSSNNESISFIIHIGPASKFVGATLKVDKLSGMIKHCSKVVELPFPSLVSLVDHKILGWKSEANLVFRSLLLLQVNSSMFEVQMLEWKADISDWSSTVELISKEEIPAYENFLLKNSKFEESLGFMKQEDLTPKLEQYLASNLQEAYWCVNTGVKQLLRQYSIPDEVINYLKRSTNDYNCLSEVVEYITHQKLLHSSSSSVWSHELLRQETLNSILELLDLIASYYTEWKRPYSIFTSTQGTDFYLTHGSGISKFSKPSPIVTVASSLHSAIPLSFSVADQLHESLSIMSECIAEVLSKVPKKCLYIMKTSLDAAVSSGNLKGFSALENWVLSTFSKEGFDDLFFSFVRESRCAVSSLLNSVILDGSFQEWAILLSSNCLPESNTLDSAFGHLFSFVESRERLRMRRMIIDDTLLWASIVCLCELSDSSGRDFEMIIDQIISFSNNLQFVNLIMNQTITYSSLTNDDEPGQSLSARLNAMNLNLCNPFLKNLLYLYLNDSEEPCLSLKRLLDEQECEMINFLFWISFSREDFNFSFKVLKTLNNSNSLLCDYLKVFLYLKTGLLEKAHYQIRKVCSFVICSLEQPQFKNSLAEIMSAIPRYHASFVSNQNPGVSELVPFYFLDHLGKLSAFYKDFKSSSYVMDRIGDLNNHLDLDIAIGIYKNNKFLYLLEDRKYEEALAVLHEIGPNPRSSDFLRMLISSICDGCVNLDQRSTLLHTIVIKLPWGALEEHVVTFLEARCSLMTFHDLLHSPINYYKILYSHFLVRGNFKRGASTMLHLSERLESSYCGEETEYFLITLGQAILLSKHCLSMLSQEGQFIQVFHGSSVIIHDIKSLSAKYNMVMCKLKLVKQNPALASSLTDLQAPDLISILSDYNLFDSAMDVACLFNCSQVIVIKKICAKCVFVDFGAKQTEGQRMWSNLKEIIDSYETERMELSLCAITTLLEINPKMQLPPWLTNPIEKSVAAIDFFKSAAKSGRVEKALEIAERNFVRVSQGASSHMKSRIIQVLKKSVSPSSYALLSHSESKE